MYVRRVFERDLHSLGWLLWEELDCLQGEFIAAVNALKFRRHQRAMLLICVRRVFERDSNGVCWLLWDILDSFQWEFIATVNVLKFRRHLIAMLLVYVRRVFERDPYIIGWLLYKMNKIPSNKCLIHSNMWLKQYPYSDQYFHMRIRILFNKLIWFNHIVELE